MVVHFSDHSLVALTQLLERRRRLATRALLRDELLDGCPALDLDLLRRLPLARIDRRLNAIGELEDLGDRHSHVLRPTHRRDTVPSELDLAQQRADLAQQLDAILEIRPEQRPGHVVV
jgi:hypothetical protein